MIYWQAAGERVLLGWVVLFDERNNKIIIKNEVLIQKRDVEPDQKTARKNEDGERDQMDKERRCRTKKGKRGPIYFGVRPTLQTTDCSRQVPSGLRSTQLHE